MKYIIYITIIILCYFIFLVIPTYGSCQDDAISLYDYYDIGQFYLSEMQSGGYHIWLRLPNQSIDGYLGNVSGMYEMPDGTLIN